MTLLLAPKRARWPAQPTEQDALLAEAAGLLRRGEVVGLPTDTVYGLAALPSSDAGMSLLYAIKGRPREKAIALLVADPCELERLAGEIPDAARELARRYWPGGLTLVLRSTADPSTTVALRMPNNDVPLRLISEVGSPLATTSANRSAAGSSRTADDVLEQLPTGYPLLIDDGPCRLGVDSTVIDLTSNPPRLLREGAIGRETIEVITGPIES